MSSMWLRMIIGSVAVSGAALAVCGPAIAQSGLAVAPSGPAAYRDTCNPGGGDPCVVGDCLGGDVLTRHGYWTSSAACRYARAAEREPGAIRVPGGTAVGGGATLDGTPRSTLQGEQQTQRSTGPATGVQVRGDPLGNGSCTPQNSIPGTSPAGNPCVAAVGVESDTVIVFNHCLLPSIPYVFPKVCVDDGKFVQICTSVGGAMQGMDGYSRCSFPSRAAARFDRAITREEAAEARRRRPSAGR